LEKAILTYKIRAGDSILAAYKGKKGSGIILIITNWVMYYKQNDFENAISQFNKIINGKDFVKCLLPFRESYLKLDKKQEALNAFKML
jgi:hypothetical protein